MSDIILHRAAFVMQCCFAGFMSNAEVEIFEDGERGTGRSYYPIALLFFRCYAFLAVPTLWGTVQV